MNAVLNGTEVLIEGLADHYETAASEARKLSHQLYGARRYI